MEKKGGDMMRNEMEGNFLCNNSPELKLTYKATNGK